MASNLFYITKEPEIINKETPLLILIHGYGSNENDLFSFANEFSSNYLIVSVQAPISLPFGGYAWYSIDFNNEKGNISNIEEAKNARENIADFIKEIQNKYAISTEKTMLLGFSQGAILSYSVVLSYPEIVQKIVALSGYMLPPILPQNHVKDYSKIAIFASHGLVDQVIPIQLAQKTVPYLKELSIQYTYKEYPVGHNVSPQNFFDAKHWIEKHF